MPVSSREPPLLKRLRLHNVGPAPEMELEFGDRLNLLTGDNGLGKSFMLDIGWWAMTRKWPAEINPKLTTGKMALPVDPQDATIEFVFTGKTRPDEYVSTYQPKEQAWTGRPGRPANPGLVLYAMTDGSFAVWDPARNYWRRQGDKDVQDRPPAYVFSPAEVWNGLSAENGATLCNGLIRDWAGWQREKGAPYERLRKLLKVIGPSGSESLEPGELTRISLDDVRNMPTIRMPYQRDVAVVHASSGIRRILALSYFLVWAWEEHKRAARQVGEEETGRIVLLIDEIDAHLHPAWQRRIVSSILSVMESLTDEQAGVQLIATTHSPLIMASAEPFFDGNKDAWFDLDFEQGEVALQSREFRKHGDAGTWLISEAFDLKSSRALEYEDLLERSALLLEEENPDIHQIKKTNEELARALSPKDEFLFNWQYICRQKGWLP